MSELERQYTGQESALGRARRWERDAAKSHADAEAIIRDLSEEDLAELKAEVLANPKLGPVAEWLADKDPRESRMLRTLIIERLKKGVVPA